MGQQGLKKREAPLQKTWAHMFPSHLSGNIEDILTAVVTHNYRGLN